MNNDLISRAALLERFEKVQSNVGTLVETVFFDGVMGMVDTAPAVDAESVRHGRWIVHDWAEECNGVMISNYECSECCSWERHETDYCPNCGAKMDGENE